MAIKIALCTHACFVLLTTGQTNRNGTYMVKIANVQSVHVSRQYSLDVVLEAEESAVNSPPPYLSHHIFKEKSK